MTTVFESEIGAEATRLLDELIELYKTDSSLQGQLKQTIEAHQSELAEELMHVLKVRRAEAGTAPPDPNIFD